MYARTLDLIASENILSPLSRVFQLSKFSEKYYLSNNTTVEMQNYTYPIDKNWVDILEAGQFLVNSLFESKWNDQRPLSGTHAMLCLLAALTKSGDSIIISPESVGGHFATEYLANRLGLKIYYNQYDENNYCLNPYSIEEIISDVKPKLITVDVSHQLFPHPIQKFREVAGKDTIITYDASQVLGLLIGKQFQDPFLEGADLIHGSTHKTFCGAQKAIFMGKDDCFKEKIDKTIFPQFSSNNHIHSMLVNYAAFLEAKIFGEDYAKQIVKNSKALAEALYDFGLPVMAKEKGFTETHQVWIDTDYSIHELNDSGIRCTSFFVPGTNCNKKGIRLGTNTVTKMGFKEHDMKEFAEFIYLAMQKELSPNIMKKKINEYILEREKMSYCFTNLEDIDKQGGLGKLLVRQIEEEGLNKIFQLLLI